MITVTIMSNAKPNELLNVVRRSAKLCLLVVGAAAAAVGCATKDVDGFEGVDGVDDVAGAAGDPTTASGGEYGEGLTVVRQDPKWGMTAVFKDRDRTILIERRVSAIKALAGAGEFEEDVLVTDAEGRVIMLKQGGDNTVEPSWQRRLEDDLAQAPVDMKQRTADLARLERATTLLLASPKLDIVARSSVKGMATVARDSLAIEPGSLETAYAPANNKLQLWKSDIKVIWKVAEHSGIWARRSGATSIRCNHGSGRGGCPDEGGMELVGTHSSPTGNADFRSCTTPYSTTSESLDGVPAHNCHDDSVIQMRAWVIGLNQNQKNRSLRQFQYSPLCAERRHQLRLVKG